MTATSGESGLTKSELWQLVARASDPQCSSRHLAALARSGDLVVRTNVASNPACPPQLLHQLAHDKEHSVRHAVAGHPKAPGDALNHLAGDAPGICQQVVKHPQCPPDALVRLLSNPLLYIRRLAAAHPNLPEEYRVLAGLEQ
jgi:hypothetical protein